eukprot:628988-Prymnesium_polylepis.1
MKYSVAGDGQLAEKELTLSRRLVGVGKMWKKNGKGQWRRKRQDPEAAATKLPLQLQQGQARSDVVRWGIHTTSTAADVHDSLMWLPDTSRSWFEHSELVVQPNNHGDTHYVRIDYHAREKPKGTIRFGRQENPVTT